jgi:hypothetical protein
MKTTLVHWATKFRNDGPGSVKTWGKWHLPARFESDTTKCGRTAPRHTLVRWEDFDNPQRAANLCASCAKKLQG